ncbi:MAG: metallophosphoesterase family protein [Lachnospiraceae bacterium]|nr:metallophosphoesterase family protein [Lachnospiraceae bacterium]
MLRPAGQTDEKNARGKSRSDEKEAKHVSTVRKLRNIAERAKVLRIDEATRIVMMSDCHRGTGNWSDNFMANQNLFFRALEYYNERRFTYIELGDGDELWENRRMEDIIRAHSDAYWLLSCFYRDHRFYMLYGNHDMQKRQQRFAAKYYQNYYCDGLACMLPLFPGIEIHEGIKLHHAITGREYLLVHGHQGDLMNDRLWKISRGLVRYLWKPLEMVGVNNPIRPAGNYTIEGHTQKRLRRFAEQEKMGLIVGHTHRPHLPKADELPFFNTGSCVHPRCITALEYEHGDFSLVKWCEATRADGVLFVERCVLASRLTTKCP